MLKKKIKRISFGDIYILSKRGYADDDSGDGGKGDDEFDEDGVDGEISKGRRHMKKIDFFRALPKKGGGRALPKIFDPFFHHVVPYILTSISCYVILFGHF